MGAKQGQSRKSGRQRLALVVFAVLLAVLFAGFAIAQGIGQPSVPSGDVAVVTSVPSDEGTISEAEFKRTLVQQAAQAKLPKAPEPGDGKYDELKAAALGELLDAIWIVGEAEELGIEVTKKQVATELAQIKKQNFKTKAIFDDFLKRSHFTLKDVIDRVKLQVLSTQIQETVTKEAPTVSDSEIADYYEAGKSTQYTTAATRDIRIVANKDKAEVEKAKVLLEKDDSPASWKKVAAKYSLDPASKTKGGLQKGLSEEVLAAQPALRTAIFDNGTGILVGPLKFKENFYVIEVVKLNPDKVQTLDEVKSQISTQLTQQAQQEFFSEFVASYQSKWESRTFCADEFTIERCANYKGSGHSASAPPGCYEADPKGGPAKECPAPVTPAAPALPGTTTLLKPQGERLPQRPRPEALSEAAAGATTLPEGATPPPPAAAPEAGG